MEETRKLNISYNISGSGHFSPKIALPKKWCDALGFTPEDREAFVTFDGKKIIIEKKQEG